MRALTGTDGLACQVLICLDQMMTIAIESSFMEQLCSRVQFRYGFHMQLLQQCLLIPAYVGPLRTFSARTICIFVKYTSVMHTMLPWFRAVWYKVLGTRRIEAIQDFVSAKRGKLGFLPNGR